MTSTADIDALLGQLRDYRTRNRARSQLAELRDVAATKVVALAQSADASENARWAAIALLGQWKLQSAVPILLELVKTDARLRSEAVRALQSITGKEIDEDVDAWESALSEKPENPQAAPPASAPGAPATADSREARMVALFQRALKGVASKVHWEEAGYIYTRIELAESRKQQVLVTFADKDAEGRQLATFYTESGEATPRALDLITRRNVTIRYGHFAVEQDADGTKKVVARHRVPVQDLNEPLIREVILLMAREADSVEFEMSQSDHI